MEKVILEHQTIWDELSLSLNMFDIVFDVVLFYENLFVDRFHFFFLVHFCFPWNFSSAVNFVFGFAETSPIGPSPKSSNMLTRQLQENWRSTRARCIPEKLIFEVTNASVVHETNSKYVVSISNKRLANNFIETFLYLGG